MIKHNKIELGRKKRKEKGEWSGGRVSGSGGGGWLEEKESNGG